MNVKRHAAEKRRHTICGMMVMFVLKESKLIELVSRPSYNTLPSVKIHCKSESVRELLPEPVNKTNEITSQGMN